jgi:hypothetical protein
LLPDREDARRLASQTFLLSEFLTAHHVPLPQLHRKAIVHGHCHHRSVMKLDAEQEALRSMGLDFDLLDSGCCGMAGSFGFERDHYDVSMKVGELVLLPAVRAAASDTLIIADGFSCRTQIAQSTDRRALHLADLIEMAEREGVNGAVGDYPESRYVPDYTASSQSRSLAFTGGALLGAGLGAAVMGWKLHRDMVRSRDGEAPGRPLASSGS